MRLHKRITDLVRDEALEYTAPEIKRNITSFGVKINGQMDFEHLTWVYGTNQIDISHWPQRAKGDFDQIKVWYENDDTLVIFKPKNLVVEPGAGHREDNLLTFLETKFKREFHLAHRIDKDTSGLLVLTKTPEQLEFIQNQFRSHTVTKKYLAVVNGLVEKNYQIHNWQARDSSSPLRQKFFWTELEAMNYDPKARDAVSLIRPITVCSESNLSLIEITIKTGRMHQIRLQCEALGFPLNQDPVYNRANDIKVELEPPSKSLFGLTPVTDLSKVEFERLQIKIFGNLEYSLLANFIKFELNPGRFWEGEVLEAKDL